MTKPEYKMSAEEHNLISYKVGELKSDFTSMKGDINDIKQSLTNIDAKFGTFASVHELKDANVERRIGIVEDTAEKAKTYVNRLAGALVVISLMIQLVAPVALGYLFPAKVSVADPPAITQPTPPKSGKAQAHSYNNHSAQTSAALIVKPTQSVTNNGIVGSIPALPLPTQ